MTPLNYLLTVLCAPWQYKITQAAVTQATSRDTLEGETRWTDEDGHVCHLRHHKVIGNQSAAVISTESMADRDSTFRCANPAILQAMNHFC